MIGHFIIIFQNYPHQITVVCSVRTKSYFIKWIIREQNRGFSRNKRLSNVALSVSDICTIYQSDVLVMSRNVWKESLELLISHSTRQPADKLINQHCQSYRSLYWIYCCHLPETTPAIDILPHFAIYQYTELATLCHISLLNAHLWFLTLKIYFLLTDFLHAAWQNFS